jgi:hypothetical protein
MRTIGSITAGVVTVAGTTAGLLTDGFELLEKFGTEESKKDSILIVQTAELKEDSLKRLPPPTSQSKSEASERKAEKKDIQKKSLASFMLNSPSTNQEGTKEIAIAIISENQFENLIGNQIADILRRKGYQSNNYFFKPKAISEGYLGKIYNIDSQAIEDLDLIRFTDEVLVGFLTIEVSSMEAAGNIVHKAVARFHANWIGVKDQSLKRNLTFDAKGVDFNEVNAKRKAQQELLKELENLL